MSPMSKLRDDIEQIVIDHFDPSVMGRAQAVDDIMAAIKQHNEALANRSMPADADVVQDHRQQIAAAVNIINVDPPMIDRVVAQIHNAAIPRRARRW